MNAVASRVFNGGGAGAHRRVQTSGCREDPDHAGPARIGRGRRRAVATPAGVGARRRARTGQRLSQALHHQGPGQGQRSAGTALCLLPHPARLRRKVAAHRRISVCIRSRCFARRRPIAPPCWRRRARAGSRALRSSACPISRKSPRSARSTCGITIVGVVDPQSDLPRFVGVPVAKVFDDIGGEVDAVLVTDMQDHARDRRGGGRRFGAERVLVPPLLARAFAKRGDVQ